MAGTETTTPSQEYHDYGALDRKRRREDLAQRIHPAAPGYVYGTSGAGITNYLDGVPLYGHTGGGNATSSVGWKD